MCVYAYKCLSVRMCVCVCVYVAVCVCKYVHKAPLILNYAGGRENLGGLQQCIWSILLKVCWTVPSQDIMIF